MVHRRIQPLPLQPAGQHLVVQRDQRGDEGLVVPDDDGMRHDRAGVDDVLHRRGADVLAARRDDDVLLASGDVEEAVIVDAAQVAAVQPAVLLKHLGGELGLLVVAEEHVRPLDHHLVVVGELQRDAGTGLAGRADTVRILEIDHAGRRRLGHAIALDEGDAVHAVEEMRQVGVHRGAAARQVLEVGSQRRSHRGADDLHVERMLQPFGHGMRPAGHLVLGPLGEMGHGLGEDPSADTSTGLLRGGVVDLLEHARHPQQIGGLESPQIGQQMVGVGDVAHHAVRADRHVLDVPGEAMRQRQEQQQAAGLEQHLVQHVVSRIHDVGEVPVREHGALRTPRGTGRVHDGGQIVGLDAGDGLVQLGIADRPAEIDDRVHAGRAEVEHVSEPFTTAAQILQDVCVRVVPGERDHRIDIIDDVLGLPGGIRLIDRHTDRADGRAGEIDDAPVVAGRRIDDDHAPRTHVQRHQSLGHGTHTLQHLRGGDIVPSTGVLVLPLGDDVLGVAGRA